MSTLTRAVSKMDIVPTLELENDASAGAPQSPTALTTGDQSYTPTTTIPVSQYIGQTETITGGSNTIDLTALVDTEGNAYSGSGKRVQEVKFKAGSANVADIVIAGGSVDPYYLFGDTNELDLEPGAEVMLRSPDNLPIIATSTAVTATDIKFTGTNGDTYTYEFLIG